MTPISGIEFFIPGRPIAQGSKRLGRHGKYPVILDNNDKTLGPWRERVALQARSVFGPGPMIAGAVRLELGFVLPRPVSTPKSRTPHAVKKPDLDKLTRAIFDALTSVCFADDSQVVALWATKRIAGLGEQPGVLVRVKPLESPGVQDAAGGAVREERLTVHGGAQETVAAAR